MSNKVKITIDGKEVSAPEGMNLIDAAELAGMHIPNLCYLKGTKGIGACRLCIVEVEGAKAHAIACNSKVKEGMVVRTATDEILESRKFIVDLILSMHPLDCMTCTKAGVCNLQRYAYDFEIKESTFTRKKFGYPTDEANPFIKRDPEYCVLCGKCVRVCKEQGTNVLEFNSRGVGARVVTQNDSPLQESGCTFCGSCVDACPVNALLEHDRWRKGREWEYEKSASVCLLCGNACDIVVSTKDGQVQKVNSGAEEGSEANYICAYGRFGYDYLQSDTRLTAPMKRKGKSLVETTWEDALDIVAKGLKKAGSKAALVSVAGITNEDALAAKRFASVVMKTKNVATTVSLYADAASLKNSGSADLEGADLIILAGLDTSQYTRVLPALDATVKRKVARGAKLVVINSADTGLDEAASVVMKGDEIKSLKALVKAALGKGMKGGKKLEDSVKDARVSEEAGAAADLLDKAVSAVIIAAPSVFGAASNVSLLKGDAVAVAFESNARGVTLMGLGDKGMSISEAASKGAKALYVVGDVVFDKKPKTEFLIVQSTHMTDLAKQADVVLPATAYLEASGSIVDFTGSLKSMPAAVSPAGESRAHGNIFMDLAKASGASIEKVSLSDVKAACKVEPKVEVRPFERDAALDVSPEMMLEAVFTSLVNNSTRLLWLAESERASAKVNV
ncbi:hypothetical protein LCGC14_1695430 [marine sediment metagenome]|uniref:Uncharacterized protein n=1 Tax=marine sediment metagenome TaxID=412755 RepID=A0A0F9K058_9ZZZZ